MIWFRVRVTVIFLKEQKTWYGQLKTLSPIIIHES